MDVVHPSLPAEPHPDPVTDPIGGISPMVS